MIDPSMFDGWEDGHLFSAVRRAHRRPDNDVESGAVPERSAFAYSGRVYQELGAWWADTSWIPNRAKGRIRLDFWDKMIDEGLYGELVRRQRQQHGMTLEELGQLARLSRASVYRIEIGTRYASPAVKGRLRIALRPPAPAEVPTERPLVIRRSRAHPAPVAEPATDWITERQAREASRGVRFTTGLELSHQGED